MPDVRGGLLAKKADPTLLQYVRDSLIRPAEAGERKAAGLKGLLGPIRTGESLVHDPVGPGRLAPGSAAGGGGSGLLKAALDPHGISGVKLDKPYTEIQFTREPSMSMLPKRVMTPEQFYAKHKGGVILPVIGDKATAGERVTSVEGNPVSVQTYGGGPFMRLKTGGVWATDTAPATKLSRQIEATQKKHDTDNVLITHATMGPTGMDFSNHPSEVMLAMLPYSKINRAGQTAVKERMEKGVLESVQGGSKRYTYPDFPGIYSSKLPDWLAASGARRKHFVQLMDNRQMLDAGVPSPAAARLSTTDAEQLGAPWFSSGMHFARAQPGLLTEGVTPHPAYPVQTPGKYAGSLGSYYPVDVMFHDWFKANAADKANWRRAFEWGGADRAQPINQQWLDRLMRYSRSR